MNLEARIERLERADGLETRQLVVIEQGETAQQAAARTGQSLDRIILVNTGVVRSPVA